MQVKMGIFIIFLIMAAWQDLCRESVELWVFVVAGVFGIACLILYGQHRIIYILGGMMGILFWAISNQLKGAVGEGDAIFFLVSGLYLGIWKNIQLMLWGLLLSGLAGGGIMLWKTIKRKVWRNIRIPFLPFLVLPGLWLVLH